jgi:hypothetical protein
LADQAKAQGSAYSPAAGLSATGLLSATTTGSGDAIAGLAGTGALNMSG